LGLVSNADHIFFSDWFFILILASVCAACAFIATIKVMRFISPYTDKLNLKPIYRIFPALLSFGQSEMMRPLYYIEPLL